MLEYIVNKDETVRTVEFTLTAGTTPLEHRPYDWPEVHREPRYFNPQSGYLTIVAGERTSITVSGPWILKGGRLSENTQLVARWSAKRISDAPEWVRDLWTRAGQVYR